MKRLAIYLLLMLATLNLAAQSDFTQSIRGTVKDQVTGAPLIGVNVVVVDTEKPIGGSTNANGEFLLEDVPVGRHDLKFSYIGYKPTVVRNQLVKSGKQLEVHVTLKERVEKLEEVTVKGYKKDRPKDEMAMVSARSFTVEETERYAGSLGDPARMVQNYAGVVASGDARNDIIIRGNAPTGLLWRLNGINIPNPNHFGAMGSTGGPVSILNNNLLQNSDFFTGAFPAQYGNAISGAFDLEMRSGNPNKREYVGQIGFNGFELGAEGPFSKNSRATYLANFRYSTLEVMNELGFDVAGQAIPQYKDGSFKVDVPTQNAGKFSLFGIGGLSYIEFLEADREDSDFSYSTMPGTDTRNGSDMGALGLTHSYFLDKNTQLKTSLSLTGRRVETTVDTIFSESNTKKLYYHEDNSQYSYGASAKITKKFNAKNNISAGVTWDNRNINYSDSARKEDGTYRNLLSINKPNLHLLQGFAQWQHNFTDRLTLYTGLHHQYFSQTDDQALEPRASLRWNFSKGKSLTAGYGMHHQTQPLFVYFIQTQMDNGTYRQTNSNLGFTESHHYVLSYKQSLTPNLRIKAEAYYQDLNDIPVTEYSSYFSMANYGAMFHQQRVDSLTNAGTGENYGIELTLEKFFSDGYYFLITSSLYESKYTPSDDMQRNTAFNGNYMVNVLGGYEWEINQRMRLALDIKMLAAGGKREKTVDLQASRQAGQPVYNEDKIYNQRLQDYMRLDGRLSFKLNGKNITQEWALDIRNVTDEKNVFVKEYDETTGSIQTKYQQRFFPMFLYRINF